MTRPYPPSCGRPWSEHPTANGEPYCERSTCPTMDLRALLRRAQTLMPITALHFPNCDCLDCQWHRDVNAALGDPTQNGPSPATARDGSVPPPDDRDYTAFDYDLDERCEP